MYISEFSNHRIRKVTASSGVITTIAGTGQEGYSGDGGQATAALISYPVGINIDSATNVYFGVSYVVRKVDVSTGIITTVAGSGDIGYNGDNIQATAASLSFPHDVVLDSDGNLYISDYSGNRIRKVDVSTGIITTVVGTGEASSTGDGSDASLATLNVPCFSRFDSAGNFYISECDGNRVRIITNLVAASPTSTPTVYTSVAPHPTLAPRSFGKISTVAGSDLINGDGGNATSAFFTTPLGIAVDSLGILLHSHLSITLLMLNSFYRQRVHF